MTIVDPYPTLVVLGAPLSHSILQSECSASPACVTLVAFTKIFTTFSGHQRPWKPISTIWSVLIVLDMASKLKEGLEKLTGM